MNERVKALNRIVSYNIESNKGVATVLANRRAREKTDNAIAGE